MSLFRKIDHVGIAVSDLEEAKALWCGKLGLEARHVETVESQGVRVAMLPVGESKIELLEPLSPETPVGKFLAKKGPGLHHVAFGVADCEAAIGHCQEEDLAMIDETPRKGALDSLIAFLHPRATQGVLTEMVERK